MITIKVEGKNIADLWKLKCVHQITKNDREGNHIFIKVAYKRRKEPWMYNYQYAYNGDIIQVESEQSEIGKVFLD